LRAIYVTSRLDAGGLARFAKTGKAAGRRRGASRTGKRRSEWSPPAMPDTETIRSSPILPTGRNVGRDDEVPSPRRLVDGHFAKASRDGFGYFIDGAKIRALTP